MYINRQSKMACANQKGICKPKMVQKGRKVFFVTEGGKEEVERGWVERGMGT